MKVTFEDILEAQKVVSKIIRPTTMDYSVSASRMLGREIYLKHENSQRTGSFKIRGAFNKMNSLTAEEKKRGAVASSAGHHAQGVAISASFAQIHAKIVMPKTAPLNKIEATRAYGAEVILHGDIYDEAYEFAKKLQAEEGLVFIHPYEDPAVIAGQGTLGLEILKEIPDLDSIIVPVGGGGLISGVAFAAKHINPKIRIIGVQSTQAPGMVQLFKGEALSFPKARISTIADGIAVKKPSQVMYDHFISNYVDEMVTVNDDDVAHGIVFLLERAKTVTEGSGAAGMAALMTHPEIKTGNKCCVLLSGGNIDLNIVAKIIERGQIQRGRLVEMSVIVDDTPGNLTKLTQVIAEQGGNVLQVHHDRIAQSLSLREAKIDFVLETTSPEHIQKIKDALIGIGSRIL